MTQIMILQNNCVYYIITFSHIILKLFINMIMPTQNTAYFEEYINY